MNADKIRFKELLKDCIPFCPIVFLLFGYFVADIRMALLPYYEVDVEVEEPLYKLQKIGEVPLDHYQNEKTAGWRDIYRNVPVLDEGGKPKKRSKLKRVGGRGKHHSKSEEYEITTPKMADPPWTIVNKKEFEIDRSPTRSRPKPVAIWVTYKENVRNVGTGFGYKTKNVEFDIGMDPKAGAIYGAAIGTILNFILLISKYINKLRQMRVL